MSGTIFGRCVIIMAGAAVAFLGATGSEAANTLFGTPAFDSGWRDLQTGLNAFSHSVGGDVGDYVVDVQLRDLAGEAGAGVSTLHFGFDTSIDSEEEAVHTGVDIYNMTSTNIFLARAADDTATDQARVRLWVVASPDYDSGWRSISAGEDLSLDHYLGGNTDDYVVDLMFEGGSPFVTIHTGGYGGDGYWDTSGKARGAYWHSLNSTSINVRRNLEDTFCQKVRVRLFSQDTPDYDSGWQTLAVNNHLVREHGLGGPWNDFLVDLQFKDTDDGLGVNQRAWGGDTVPGPPDANDYYGAYWHHLTGAKIQVWRFADDFAADQVRVRLWEDRNPSYDSGWTDLESPGVGEELVHNLGGDPDMYIVDMEFRDTNTGQDSTGVNTKSYGFDRYFEPISALNLQRGAHWYELTGTSISVIRAADDITADQVRIRLWQTPMPEYDSGWLTISQGQALPLVFPETLSGSTDDYVVALDLGTGVFRHQVYYGIDTDEFSGTLGAYWRTFTTSSIEVVRGDDDPLAGEIRMRIWKNTAFDYTGGWLRIGSTVSSGLDVPADELVVDLQMDSDDPTYGRNHYRFGGDRFDEGGGLYNHGTWWQDLSSSSLRVLRSPFEHHADGMRVRLWNAPTGLSSFTLTISLAGAGDGFVISSPSGIMCGLDCSEVFAYGQVIALTATPASGSTFSGWSGSPICTNGAVEMTADLTCTATFTVGGVFSDGFESGDLTLWSASVGD